MRSILNKLRSCQWQILGISCALSWLYYSFFSCGLVPIAQTVRCIERAWVFVGLGAALLATFFVLSFRWGRGLSRWLQRLGVTCAVAGTVIIWCGFLSSATYQAASTIGGILCGFGSMTLFLLWGDALCLNDEEEIETIIPAAFVLSFVAYGVMFAFKGPITLALDALLPIVSAAAAHRAKREERPIPSEKDEVNAPGTLISWRSWKSQVSSILPIALTLGLLWFQLAYFRLLATPGVGYHIAYYLTPFSCALALSLVGLVFYMRCARLVSFALLFRWSVPLLMVGYALLYALYGNPAQRVIASTIGFVAMFGAQFAFWMAMPKYVRRTGLPPIIAFCVPALCEGLGVFLGALVGLYPLDYHLPLEDTTVLSLLLFAGLLMAVMVVGFTPRYSYFGSLTFGEEATVLAEAERETTVEDAFAGKALRLREAFGLTKRETDVAALLLMGKSRSYIRDELVVSLNTVHTHIRSIYAKCDVHSRQELMDLMDALERSDVSQ